MAYSFEQVFAADPSNPANVARNAAVTIFAPGDIAQTPLTLTTPNGDPLANPLQVNNNGFGSAFMHATLDRVAWAGGNFTGFFTSYEGMKAEAVSARTAAQTAASTAGADAAAVATAAIGTATDDAEAAATSAAAAATAAANSAALVGAPADSAIAAAINGAGTATKTALTATYASKGALKAAAPNVFDGLKSRLDMGLSASMSWLTDSTGNDPVNEHIGRTSTAIGALYPNHKVVFRGYDNAAPNNYSVAPVVIQPGVGGERKITFGTTGYLQIDATPASSITGDLQVSAKVAMTDWAHTGSNVIASKFNAGGSRSWYWVIQSGWMYLYYTTDGTTQLSASVAMGSFGQVNGTPHHFKVILDVDNGASGRTVKFYQSATGATWTQIGTDQTAAGTITLFTDSVTPLLIGARVGISPLAGSIYWVEVRAGIDGAIVAPTLIDLWSPTPSTFNGTFSGAPILEVWAGAASGWGTIQFVTNADRMIPAVGQSLHMMGTSHNEGFNIDDGLWARWDTCLAAVKAKTKLAAIGVFNQNFQTAPQTPLQILSHATRCRAMASYARRNGYQFFDVYQAFIDSPLTDAELVSNSDGVHMTNVGSQLWSDVEMRGFGLIP